MFFKSFPHYLKKDQTSNFVPKTKLPKFVMCSHLLLLSNDKKTLQESNYKPYLSADLAQRSAENAPPALSVTVLSFIGSCHRQNESNTIPT